VSLSGSLESSSSLYWLKQLWIFFIWRSSTWGICLVLRSVPTALICKSSESAWSGCKNNFL
jgi:hypothetical protein